MILLDDGVDRQTSGGLFDWTPGFLIDRLGDQEAGEMLRQIVDNNLGSLWLTEFAPPVQIAALQRLAHDLVAAGEQQLPPSDRRADALTQLHELAGLASSCLERRA